MPITQCIYRLKGKVQHYTWGGYNFIPELVSLDNKEEKPFAEYWLGAHPNHPATIQNDTDEIPLNVFIANYQESLGGAAKRFDTLPFLLKILDVRQMLSIQVHPNKTSAEIGFDKENESQIPLTAPARNYKDANHKPEMMVALSDFWLLHGFKPADKLLETLAAIPDLEFLKQKFEEEDYKGLYETVMLMEQAEVNQILKPIIERILPLYENGELLKSQESFWAARAAKTFCTDDNYDRGIFSIFFFNLVHLKKGEGIYQGEGLPHAYLEGQNIELMANSDNVLRAGLTDKHIDVAELLKHVAFVETLPKIFGSHAQVNDEIHFKTPAEEFELYRYQPQENKLALHAKNAEIILVVDGDARISSGNEVVDVKKGDAVFVSGGCSYFVTGASADLFRATTPSVFS